MPVLYGCENWSPREFENRVLGRTFKPKKDGVTGELRKLHNEEINYIYSSPNIIRVIKSGIMVLSGHVARMGRRTVLYRVLAVKPEGKGTLGRHRCRWKDNIKMDLQKVVCGGLDWIDLAQDKDK